MNGQVRKLATGYRLKRFKELLPGLDTETLFTDFPKVLLMDLKKVKFGVAHALCAGVFSRNNDFLASVVICWGGAVLGGSFHDDADTMKA